MTALAAATLDRLSNGRVILVMGAGRTSWMRDMLGYKRRATGDLENSVKVIRKIMNENVNYTSSGFSLKNASLDEKTVRSDLPIYLAAPNDTMIKLASRIAEGVFLGPRLRTAIVRRSGELVKKWSGTNGWNRAVEIGAEYPLRVTNEPEKELQSLKPTLAYYLSLPEIGEEYLKLAGFDSRMLGPIRDALKTPSLIAQGQNPYDAFKVGDIAEAVRNVPDDLMEQCSLVGTPGKCRESIAELEGAGLSFIALAFQRSFDQTIQRLEELLS